MRLRQLLAFAVALAPWLGGCSPKPCDAPTVTLKWKLQDLAGATVDCATAGVTTVKVTLGGRTRLLDCTTGKAVIDVSGLPAGSYDVVVDGLAPGPPAELVTHRALFKAAVGTCGDSLHVPVLGRGVLDVDYHFGTTPATDVCHGGAMWFALRDDTSRAWVAVVDATTPIGPAPDLIDWRTYYGCTDSLGNGRPVRFTVPFGPYTLTGIQEVTFLGGAPAALYEWCAPTTVEVKSPTTTYLTPPDLRPRDPVAPACFPDAAP